MAQTRKSEVRENERFYCRHGGLTCYPSKSKRVVQDGVSTVVDPPAICFSPGPSVQTPSGDTEKWGVYMTNDPAIKEYLLDRGDVLTEEQFFEQTKSVEEKLQEQDRVIENQNRLIESLQQQLSRKSGN